jgi:hypothetical protein
VTTTVTSDPRPRARQIGTSPIPPGSLTAPATGPEVLTFLKALGQWAGELGEALEELDAAAQLATRPDEFTSEITLAMSMRQSIDTRYRELVAAYDSGRVGPDERAELAQLMWGRLPDALGAPTAFTLTEACTLAAALGDRLHAALSSDAVGGSGVANRILTVRAAIERCRRQIEVLGIDPSAIEVQSTRLEHAVAGGTRDEIRTAVDEVDRAVTALERELIKEASLRASTAHRLAEYQQRYTDLLAQTTVVRELADRCRSKVADPPDLAVPDVAVIGAPPDPPSAASSDAASWAAARGALDTYAARIDRCGRALDEAQRAYGAPLDARDELRGLLGAYRTRAARSGLAEDATLATAYEAARDVLWTAPCDLTLARRRVEEYQHAVRVAVGADPGDRGAPS